MKRITAKLLSVFLIILTLFSSAFISVGAVSYSNDVKTVSDSILLVNMDSGQTVFEKDADSKRYPASTTKIMTYIIVVENIDDLDNTRVPIKAEVLEPLKNTGSSIASVEDHIGKTMSVIDLLYSMMVPSGNDASLVLADYVGGGSIEKFVKMMNDKAKELGCKNTNFVNPEGLHDDNHYTTARDLYTITNYAMTLPRFVEITDTTSYTCEGDDYPLHTTNYLIDQNNGGEYFYTYAKGIKTGTTDEAGRCLVTTASADGYSYMAILLHAPYKAGVIETYGTMTDAANLFRWALTQLELEKVATSSTPMCEQKIKLAWGKDSLNLVPDKTLSAIVPKDIESSEVVVETNKPDSIDAPIKKGDKVGTATIYYQDKNGGEKQKLAEVNLVAEETVEASGILYVLNVIGTIFKSYWFLLIIGLIVVILVIYFILSKINKKRSRKNNRVKRYRNL